MQIKVLGSGCANCKKLYKRVQEAVQELGRDDEVLYVTDMVEIAKTGVMGMPVLMFDGHVQVAGRVLSKNEIKQLLSQAE